MDKAKPSLLVLVVEIDSLLSMVASRMDTSNASATVEGVIGAIILYCSSYSLMHRQNRLAVIATLSGSMSVIYPTSQDDFVPLHHKLAESIGAGLRTAIEAQLNVSSEYIPSNIEQQEGELSRGSLSQAMSTALSIVHRQKQLQSRVLVVQFERDKHQNYNALMNSIFR